MFLKNSFDKVPVNFLKEIRHDLLLNFSEDFLFDNGKDNTFQQAYVELPYPIHKPLQNNKKDNVKLLLEEKSEYLKLIETKRKRYKFDKKIIAKEKIGATNYIHLPRHLLEFYRKKDPDPHFFCDYNYYYTGGTLDYLQLNNSEYLIRSNCDNILCLSDLRNSSDVTKLDYATSTPIYSINSIKSNGKPHIVLREKCQVSIVELNSLEEVHKKYVKEYDRPILDAKLNYKEASHLGIINYKLKLNVVDIETNKTIFNVINKSADCDSFQQFRFIDQNIIILMDRLKVKIIDYRAKHEEKLYDPQLINCNSLCNVDVVDNSLMLASRHYLLKTDLRYLHNPTYFSHSLTMPPLYMDIMEKGDDTYLSLASQDNKILFTGKSVYSLPFKVPSIQETLTESYLKHPSLLLFNGLEERLLCSTAGLKLVTLDDDIFIYWCNVFGEIFRQKVSKNVFDSEKPAQDLFNWTKELEQPESTLHITNIEEMSRARFLLNNAPIRDKLERYRRESKASKFLEQFGPKFLKKNVVGTMAKDFLSIWEDSGDEEEEVENLPEVASSDKVNSWIQTHDFSDNENTLGAHIVTR